MSDTSAAIGIENRGCSVQSPLIFVENPFFLHYVVLYLIEKLSARFELLNYLFIQTVWKLRCQSI